MSRHLVEAYSKTFAREKLSPTAFACIKDQPKLLWRSEQVAKDSGYVAWPRATSSACVVASYSMLKREELFQHQVWDSSILTDVQRQFPAKYPEVDFHFWVKYGSWSRCPHCGSMHFNDKYFTDAVYQDFLTQECRTVMLMYLHSIQDIFYMSYAQRMTTAYIQIIGAAYDIQIHYVSSCTCNFLRITFYSMSMSYAHRMT